MPDSQIGFEAPSLPTRQFRFQMALEGLHLPPSGSGPA